MTNTKSIEFHQVTGLSVDFGGTKTLAARLHNGKIVKQLQIATEGDATVDRQISSIIDLLQQLSITTTDKVAVAVAGRITATGVWEAVNSKTLSEVKGVPICEILARKLNRRVIVKNDALAALLGEAAFGAARGYPRVAFITVSTGIGGAIVLDGIPLVSADGIAGHIGFSTSRYATEQCGCGRMQTVESVASGRAIAASAIAGGHPVNDAKEVYAAHLKGLPWATALIQVSAKATAELCANLQSILGLDLIVIGGGIGWAPGYLAMVRQSLAVEPAIFQVKLVATELAANAALYGALLDD